MLRRDTPTAKISHSMDNEEDNGLTRHSIVQTTDRKPFVDAAAVVIKYSLVTTSVLWPLMQDLFEVSILCTTGTSCGTQPAHKQQQGSLPTNNTARHAPH
uniref:Uncharacterized protein n=1 Tax=Cyanoptyche gloeocystis TaxID=77922 RepID=A0A7S2JMI5_9EUKA